MSVSEDLLCSFELLKVSASVGMSGSQTAFGRRSLEEGNDKGQAEELAKSSVAAQQLADCTEFLAP